jgi:hypothetical protein
VNASSHAQYLIFLRVAGAVFSPMFGLAEQAVRSCRYF